jgi:hypothetical protein
MRPEPAYQAESLRSLKFAEAAMRITCRPVSNKVSLFKTN